jgi:hypothetical protein
MTQTKLSLAGLTPEELQKILTERYQQPAFVQNIVRLGSKRQIFSEMRNNPTELRGTSFRNVAACLLFSPRHA